MLLLNDTINITSSPAGNSAHNVSTSNLDNVAGKSYKLILGKSYIFNSAFQTAKNEL